MIGVEMLQANCLHVYLEEFSDVAKWLNLTTSQLDGEGILTERTPPFMTQH